VVMLESKLTEVITFGCSTLYVEIAMVYGGNKAYMHGNQLMKTSSTLQPTSLHCCTCGLERVDDVPINQPPCMYTLFPRFLLQFLHHSKEFFLF
jgi:hypothetical protein